MAKILMIRHMNALRPVDDIGEEAFSKIKPGSLVLVEIKQPRHLTHHKLYWVLIGLVWHQCDTERWPTPEDFSDSVKVTAGLRRTLFLPDGGVIYTPGSIAFHNMDQTVFAAFFDRVLDVIARDFLPGITSNELYEEVSFIVGAAFMPKRMAA